MKRIMILALILVVGCGQRTYQDVKEAAAAGEGVVKVYSDLSSRKALEIARKVMKDQGAVAFRGGEDQGWLIGEIRANAVTAGSYCGVYPKEVGTAVEVRVICMRKSARELATGLTEGWFFNRFARSLDPISQEITK